MIYSTLNNNFSYFETNVIAKYIGTNVEAKKQALIGFLYKCLVVGCVVFWFYLRSKFSNNDWYYNYGLNAIIPLRSVRVHHNDRPWTDQSSKIFNDCRDCFELHKAIWAKLLPTHHHLTNLVIKVQAKTMHGGIASTLTAIRDNYWIPRGREIVKSLVWRCIACTRCNGKPFPLFTPPSLPHRVVLTMVRPGQIRKSTTLDQY